MTWVWNKKHSSKQVVSVTYTTKKKFLAAATFNGLWALSNFSNSKKKQLVYTLVFFTYLEKRVANRYYLWEVNHGLLYLQCKCKYRRPWVNLVYT